MESPPESAAAWKSQDVLSFLERCRLDSLAPGFQAHHICGKDLLVLTEADLKADLGITDLHMRKKLVRKIEKLRAAESSRGTVVSHIF